MSRRPCIGQGGATRGFRPLRPLLRAARWDPEHLDPSRLGGNPDRPVITRWPTKPPRSHGHRSPWTEAATCSNRDACRLPALRWRTSARSGQSRGGQQRSASDGPVTEGARRKVVYQKSCVQSRLERTGGRPFRLVPVVGWAAASSAVGTSARVQAEPAIQETAARQEAGLGLGTNRHADGASWNSLSKWSGAAVSHIRSKSSSRDGCCSEAGVCGHDQEASLDIALPDTGAHDDPRSIAQLADDSEDYPDRAGESAPDRQRLNHGTSVNGDGASVDPLSRCTLGRPVRDQDGATITNAPPSRRTSWLSTGAQTATDSAR